MKSNVRLLSFLLLACASSWANQAFTVNCNQGGTRAVVQGINSSNKLVGSYPGCLVTVFTHGISSPLPQVFDDSGNTISNPFATSGSTGQATFQMANGKYDIQLSGGGMPSAVTIPDVRFEDNDSSGGLSFCSVAFNAAPTFNSASCNIFQMTLTGNVTSSIYATANPGAYTVFILCQDSSGGHTFTWPTTMIDTPPINQTANQCTNISFVADSTPKFHALGAAGNGSNIVATTLNNGAGVVNIPSTGTATIVAGSNGVVPSSCPAANFVNQINSSGVLICVPPVTANTGTANQFMSSNTAAGVFTTTQPTLTNIAAGVAGSGTYDFAGTTVFKIRVAAGLTAAVNGECGFDSTSGNYHCWNGADNVVGLWSATPTTTDCVKATVSANKVSLTDNGGPCAITIAPVASNFLTGYTSTTGVFTKSQPAFTDISGSVAASQLPNPSSTTLGGVKSLALVTHKFLTDITTGGLPEAAQPVAADMTPGSNGQCLNTTGGVSVWGSCAGTAGVQTLSNPNTTTVSVNGNTAAAQNLMSQTIGGAGSINVAAASFQLEGFGLYTAVNSSETITVSALINPAALSMGSISFVPALVGPAEAWRVKVNCTTTVTGAAGTVECVFGGEAALTTTTGVVFPGTALNVSPVDLTQAITVQFQVTFTSASTSNTGIQTYLLPLRIQ